MKEFGRCVRSIRPRSSGCCKQGAQILVLDDSGLVDGNGFAMPMLLAISHVHQLLIKADLRMSTKFSR